MRRRGRGQDRSGPARRLQVRDGRQTVRHPCPHHPAGVAALQHHSFPHGSLPRKGGDDVPLPHRKTAEGDPPGPAVGQCGHRGGHPPAAVQGREVPRPRPCHHRRGAALRCEAQGKAQGELHRGGHAHPFGYPHPPHAEHGHERHPGPFHHRAAAHRAAARGDLCAGIQRRDPCRSHEEGACPGRAGVLPAQPGGQHRSLRRPCEQAGARRTHRHCPRQDDRGRAEPRVAASAERRDRYSGVHHPHRDRHRRAQLQHPHHRGR